MVWEIKLKDHIGPPLAMGRNLSEAAENGDIQRLEEILPHVSTDQLNQPSGVYGWSALSAAVHGDHAAAVQLLLASGANPNWQDGDGDCFPINWASSAEVASLLVEAGCTLHVRNRQGELPADAARRWRPWPHTMHPRNHTSLFTHGLCTLSSRKSCLAVAMVCDEGGRNPRASWVPLAKPKPHMAKEGEESRH